MLSKHSQNFFSFFFPLLLPSPPPVSLVPFPSDASPWPCHGNPIKCCVHPTHFHPLKNHSSVHTALRGNHRHGRFIFSCLHKYFKTHKGVENIVNILVVRSKGDEERWRDKPRCKMWISYAFSDHNLSWINPKNVFGALVCSAGAFRCNCRRRGVYFTRLFLKFLITPKSLPGNKQLLYWKYKTNVILISCMLNVGD